MGKPGSQAGTLTSGIRSQSIAWSSTIGSGMSAFVCCMTSLKPLRFRRLRLSIKEALTRKKQASEWRS